MAFFIIAAECDKNNTYAYKLSGHNFTLSERKAPQSVQKRARDEDGWEDWPEAYVMHAATSHAGSAGSSADHAIDL